MSSTYGNMTYDFGKEYVLEEELELCKNGFHFSRHMHEPFIFYDKDSRLFEVEASGKILESALILCTNKIKLVRELTQEEINKYFQDNLDTLINDESYRVRRVVARQGYGLDKLINGESYRVRHAVAEQGYGLDKLINDECYLVRICAENMIEKMRNSPRNGLFVLR